MSVEQIERTLLQLPRVERRQFADWFYQHANEIIEPEDDEDISPELKAAILRRRDEIDARPELLEAWDGTTERVRARLHEIRRQEAQAR